MITTATKRLAILGSTGSIGTQTLNVVRHHPDRFSVEVLCAGSNADLLAQQALEFEPNAVAIADESKYAQLNATLAPHGIKVFAGRQSVADLMEMSTIDIVVAAIVGFAGLEPTLRAVRCGKTIALANKETMVVAGDIVTREARRHHAAILPVDSEHSAIFQCLLGNPGQEVDRLLLTASGGPFRGMTRQQLAHVGVADALHHPNWSMGAKVTIDSATLMNKGLEVIEAHWFFGVPAERIEPVVHPQSVVHSMVQYADGSVIAQLGVPTMETPIMFALSFPDRLPTHLPKLDFATLGALTFERPDRDTFRCLDLAFSALQRGGNAPCALNAANEVAVRRFMQGQLSFLEIADFVQNSLERCNFIANPTLSDLIETDKTIRTA